MIDLFMGITPSAPAETMIEDFIGDHAKKKRNQSKGEENFATSRLWRRAKWEKGNEEQKSFVSNKYFELIARFIRKPVKTIQYNISVMQVNKW